MMLAGERVWIRPLERADLEGDTEWVRTSPEPIEGIDKSTILRKLREVYEESQRDSRRAMFVILNEESEGIGRIEYLAYRPAERCTRCNISLSEPYTGRGYGTDALRIFSEFLFETLEIDLIELLVYMENERAIRCYWKCGYRISHCFPEKRGVLVMVLERSDV